MTQEDRKEKILFRGVHYNVMGPFRNGDLYSIFFLLRISKCSRFGFYLAFDGRTRSAREFLNRMYSNRFHKANPTLKLNAVVLNTADVPKIAIEFIDGSKKEIDTNGYHAHELLDEVHVHASSIEYQYQLDGKEIA